MNYPANPCPMCTPLVEALTARAEKAEAEVARLRAALEEAEDLAAEGVSYTSPYFVQKWRMAERLEEIREALKEREPS